LPKKLDLLWFISFTAFMLGTILSLRQEIKVEEVAPYLVIFTPYLVQTFFNAYRVRLKEFRTKHKNIAIFVLFMLFINSAVTYFNKPLYLLLDKPAKHFAYEYHFTKELANKLKELNITSVQTSSNLAKKLKFYGIGSGGEYNLRIKPINKKDSKTIKIKIFNKTVQQYLISNKNQYLKKYKSN